MFPSRSRRRRSPSWQSPDHVRRHGREHPDAAAAAAADDDDDDDGGSGSYGGPSENRRIPIYISCYSETVIANYTAHYDTSESKLDRRVVSCRAFGVKCL